jgi:cytochrome P450
VSLRFDPYHPDFISNPYPVYKDLRRSQPVFFDDRWNLTFFARHRDVEAILRDRRFGRDIRHVPEAAQKVDATVYDRIYPPQYPVWTRLIRDSFIDLEPPRHTRIRRLVQWAFTRRASQSYRPRMKREAHRRLDLAQQSGRIEAIADYATPIPLVMIAELMGVPPADQPLLVEWSHRIVRVFDEGCTPEEGQSAERAIIAFRDYMGDLIEHHRRQDGDDLLSHLIRGHEGDVLTREELIATAILVLNAGHEATVQAIGNGLMALASFPGQWRRWRADRSLTATAVEELLRYDNPLQMFERWVTQDVEWDGTQLAAGSKVGLLFGSANRDEDVFHLPDRIDVNRSPNPHVSFGGGVHFCVGAALAREELKVAFEVLLDRVRSFNQYYDSVDRIPSLVFRGVKTLWLDLEFA